MKMDLDTQKKSDDVQFPDEDTALLDSIRYDDKRIDDPDFRDKVASAFRRKYLKEHGIDITDSEEYTTNVYQMKG